ncbi:hypothetical protein ACFPRL_22405 [Pseudoclavibacter helvolus]
MEASGVRSSWLASATNWRIFASLASRAVNAREMCPSIVLKACPIRPTSVRGSASLGSTRTSRAASPDVSGSFEMLVARCSTRSSGAMDARIHLDVKSAASAMPSSPMSAIMRLNVVVVALTSPNGNAMTTP